MNVAKAGKLLLRRLVDQDSLILGFVLGSLGPSSRSLLLVLLMLRHLGPYTGLHHKVIFVLEVKLVSPVELHPDVAHTVIGQSGVVAVQVTVAVKPGSLMFWPPGSLGRLPLPLLGSFILLAAGGVTVTGSLLWLLKLEIFEKKGHGYYNNIDCLPGG